jgi:sterol 14-demethylase
MPYCLGLQAAAEAFLSIGLATQFTLAVVAFLLIVTIISAFQKDGVDSPTSLPGSSLFSVYPFFRRRYDFLNWGFHATGQSIFRFNLLRVSIITSLFLSPLTNPLQNTVVVVSGESARQAFFTAKGLDLTEGFKILSGAVREFPAYIFFAPLTLFSSQIPMVRGVTSDLQTRRIQQIHKRLANVQRNGPLNERKSNY